MTIDLDTLEFIASLSDNEKNAYELFQERFDKITDTSALKKYTPDQLIKAARTQEELFSVRRFLQQQDTTKGITGGQPWWQIYHQRRIDLGHQVSYFGEGKFTVPLAPETYRKDPFRSGIQGYSVQRNLIGGFVDYEQATGSQPLKVFHPSKTRVPIPLTNKAYIFDLETTGLLKGEANILSLGAYSEGAVSEHYTLLKEFGDKKYTSFIKHQQIPQYERGLAAFIEAGGKASTEKSLVKTFISELTPGRTLMGYNINKFDIPMMFEAAQRHGLEKQLTKAISKTQIVDVAEHVIPFLQEKLGGKVVGWEAGMTAELGLSPRGWKLGAVARGFGLISAEELAKGAHTAGFDAELTSKVWEAIKADKSFNIKTFANTVEDLSGLKLKFYSDLTDKAGQLFAPKQTLQTQEYYDKPLHQVLAEELGEDPARAARLEKTAGSTVKPQLGRSIGKIATEEALEGSLEHTIKRKAFSAFPTETRKISSFMGDTASKFKGLSGRGKAGVGAGLALLGLGFAAIGSRPETRSQERFDDSGISKFLSSGGKYDFNTIEGVHPGSGGMGAQSVRGTSDFGSGYKGLPGELMGQPIDMRVLKFRADIWEDPQKRAELQQEIKEKEAIAQAKMGSFTQNQLQAFMTTGLEGVNPSRNLERVDLDQFKMKVEDADTLVLEQSSGKNVMIRLAGIDAPETAGHADDPMEALRIEQEQPYGQEAAERLREILAENQNVQLLIDKSQKTYGRYVGTLVGDEGRNINIQLAREGAVGALPFGPETKDVVLRSEVATAQAEARAKNRGMWQFSRYRAQALAEAQTGQAITQNTLTVLDRLGKNLSLGAYFSFLESLGSSKGDLSLEEMARAEQMGRVLRSSHGGYRKRKYNQKEGLHPGSQGIGARAIRSNSDFGSGGVISKILSRAANIFKKKPQLSVLGGRTTGLSIKEISSFAKQAKTQIAEEFAVSLGVNPTLKTSLAAKYGGGLNKPNLEVAERLVEEQGFKRLKKTIPFVDKIQSILTGGVRRDRAYVDIAGMRSFGYSEGEIKRTIFHEASETLGFRSLAKDKQITPLFEGLVPHKIAVAQEDMFVRELGDKALLSKTSNLRRQPNIIRFSAKDDAWNTIEGLHPGSDGIGAEVIRKLTNFGSGWTGDILALFSRDKREIVHRVKEGFDASSAEQNKIATRKALKAIGRDVPEEFAETKENFNVGGTSLYKLGFILPKIQQKYNEIEAMHPGSPSSVGARAIQDTSDFGSGGIFSKILGRAANIFKKAPAKEGLSEPVTMMYNAMKGIKEGRDPKLIKELLYENFKIKRFEDPFEFARFVGNEKKLSPVSSKKLALAQLERRETFKNLTYEKSMASHGQSTAKYVEHAQGKYDIALKRAQRLSEQDALYKEQTERLAKTVEELREGGIVSAPSKRAVLASEDFSKGYMSEFHEMLEVLHHTPGQTKQQLFGTHVSKKVIEDEAVLRYLSSKTEFDRGLKMRMFEGGLEEQIAQRGMIGRFFERDAGAAASRVRKAEKKLSKMKKKKGVSADQIAQREEILRHERYRKETIDIYKETPARVKSIQKRQRAFRAGSEHSVNNLTYGKSNKAILAEEFSEAIGSREPTLGSSVIKKNTDFGSGWGKTKRTDKGASSRATAKAMLRSRKKPREISQKNLREQSQIRKRQRAFRVGSEHSVGIGLRSAHKAGRGHAAHTSTRNGSI